MELPWKTYKNFIVNPQYATVVFEQETKLLLKSVSGTLEFTSTIDKTILNEELVDFNENYRQQVVVFDLTYPPSPPIPPFPKM